MKDMTLVLPVRDGKILLGMKKRGFGAGKVNSTIDAQEILDLS